MTPIQTYLTALGPTLAQGAARELSYRPALANLLAALIGPAVAFLHEGQRLPGIGAPDFLAYATLHGARRLVGCIETKDIQDQDLHGRRHNQDQFNRYKANIPVCVFTNYLRFAFYHNGELQEEITLATLDPQTNKITPRPENHPRFIALLETAFIGQEFQIKTADQLVAAMASRARLLRDAIAAAMQNPQDPAGDTFTNFLRAFRQHLLQDITAPQFADLFAQTTAYGLLIARAKCPPNTPFTRQQAGDLIPPSILFLRGFFNLIAGNDIEPAIKWIVDGMADIFAAADVRAIMQRHGQQTAAQDPVFHFYESFLGKYAPQERAKRGVWYTPEPVVGFIVRAVHHILQQRLAIPNGLANTDMADASPQPAATAPAAAAPAQPFHKVQILDPAAGTGAFLAQVIRHIRAQVDPGAWNGYVESHLLPRVNGFEILMAPYAMAHLQLGELLKTTGYAPRQTPPPRQQIFLTDALQQQDAEAGSLLAKWLAAEAQAANHIKRHAPVLCVLGNPPYLAASANTGDWIMDLMADYKTEPGGKVKLQEKNPKAVNDDYVKFIRYAQHFIQKGGRGVVAFINPHGYLDAPTFRGMRWCLLAEFDSIYVIDLHGNARKNETAPDGGKDDNVFNIQQGVCINLFVKTGEKPDDELARVYHHDLYGARQHKYDFLRDHSLTDIPFTELQPQAPMYYMVPRDYQLQSEYERGIAVNDLFMHNSVGMITSRDRFCIQFSKDAMQKTIAEFLPLSDEEAREKFSLGKDSRDWRVSFARQDLSDNHPDNGRYCPIAYRAFDDRWTFYTGNNKGFHEAPRETTMRHFLAGDNIALVACRQTKSSDGFSHVFVTDKIMDRCLMSNRSGEENYVFPLYLYTAPNDLGAPAAARTPNLNMTLVDQIATRLALQFSDKESDQTITPQNILDYAYAALHSPAYRKKYAQFLKTDFPRIPMPQNTAQFRRLAGIGQHLRQLHLLQHPGIQTTPVTYPISGDDTIRTIQFKPAPHPSPPQPPTPATAATQPPERQAPTPATVADHLLGQGSATDDSVSSGSATAGYGRVYINATQYFANVPAAAWQCKIGGYHPAQKFLKDRKNHTLPYQTIQHYKHLIQALAQTQTLAPTIDQ